MKFFENLNIIFPNSVIYYKYNNIETISFNIYIHVYCFKLLRIVMYYFM